MIPANFEFPPIVERAIRPFYFVNSCNPHPTLDRQSTSAYPAPMKRFSLLFLIFATVALINVRAEI